MIARGAQPPDPGRSVAGRHVLGSSPESLEPVGPPSLPSLPVSDDAGGAEPARTIYGDAWANALRRLGSADAKVRPLLLGALRHVEAGWEHVRELQRWYDENAERAIGGHDEYAQILHFMDGDLVDLFRVIADEVAALVPGYPGWREEADVGTLHGDLDVFRRYLTVFLLAIEQAPDAEALRPTARAAGKGLAGWCTEMAVLLAAIDTAFVLPLLKASS
jgi:hypothetical protein